MIKISELINNYEAWMQGLPISQGAKHLSKEICTVRKDNHTRMREGVCADCLIHESVGDSAKLGEEIFATNAGHAMFLTEMDLHFRTAFVVQEGDSICSLLPGRTLFILRKTDDVHWTLVGHLPPRLCGFKATEYLATDPSNPRIFRLR